MLGKWLSTLLSRDLVERLSKVNLRGAIDMHVHPGPDQAPRISDFIEVAEEAQKAGMKAIVYKPLGTFPTMDKAFAAQKSVPGIKIFGGIILDYPVGGLNARAVESAIRLGAKVIWMPVLDAQHTRKDEWYRAIGYIKQEQGISILDAHQNLRPEVYEILGLIADAKDVILCTGHISPEESLVLIREAKKQNVKNIIVTHVNASVIGATLEQQKEMVRLGAYLEFSGFQPLTGLSSPKNVVESIKEIGAEHCILVSDGGHVLGPTPVTLLLQWIKILMAHGISEEEIDLMVRQNPAKILGL